MKTILMTLSAMLLLSVGSVIAEQPEPTAQPLPDNLWTTENDATVHFICPVCDMFHTKDEAKGVAVVDGMRYYLCHPSEQAKLRSNPDAYLGDRYFIPMNLVSFDKRKGSSFRDPVNGHLHTLSDTTPHHDLPGYKRYFFDSEESRDSFVANPEKYVGE